MKRSGAGYGPVNNWRWRSARRFVREQHALTLPGSDLEQAEALLGIAHAFGAVSPADRRGIERRLA
ncbi:MAG: hypothetical protein WBQ44_17195 [Rhodococcus sp. (in: high G+C Gram-positive bacteria)]